MIRRPKVAPSAAVLLTGMLLVGAAWSGLLLLAALRGRDIAPFSVWYNLPITLVFGALGLDLAIRCLGLDPRHAFWTYGPVVVVWVAGAGLLFLRLIAKSIDVSGHMTWAILMAVQCVVHGAPRWFTTFAWCVVLQVLLLKLFVLGGHSGTWGLVAGGVLGSVLVMLERSIPEEGRA